MSPGNVLNLRGREDEGIITEIFYIFLSHLKMTSNIFWLPYFGHREYSTKD
jgi:hypothetical protein